MVSFFAFLHHLAVFSLVAALAVEFVLVKGELTVETARRLLRTDAVFGASAGAALIVGLIRVFFLEKGGSYYFHSAPFIGKLSLFAAVGLLSIYPTVEFLSWRASLKDGILPIVAPEKMRTLRRITHWELVGVVLILICAALMARGVGYFGT
jgi:putative membrane protein